MTGIEKLFLIFLMAALASCGHSSRKGNAADGSSGNVPEKSNSEEIGDSDLEKDSKPTSTQESEATNAEEEDDFSGNLDPEFEECRARAKSKIPSSMMDVVGWINDLPKPVSIPCFLASLPRDLEVRATNSSVSAQPSTGFEAPRIFLRFGELYLSLVGAGPGSDSVEFSEFDGVFSSIKGDLRFPVEEELNEGSLFSHLLTSDQRATTCGACHGFEKKSESYASVNAFSSRAIKPGKGSLLDLEDLERIRGRCEGSLSKSCRLLQALYYRHRLKVFDFPETMTMIDR